MSDRGAKQAGLRIRVGRTGRLRRAVQRGLRDIAMRALAGVWLSLAAVSCGIQTPSHVRGGSRASAVDAGLDASGSAAGYPPLDFASIGQATLVSGQFYFSEGPVWDPKDNVLYFTDINATHDSDVGGAIYRLTLPDTIDVVLQPAGNADGLALDADGNLIAAGFVSRNVWRLVDGTMQTLAPCDSPASASCYDGKQLNTPDEVAVRSDGMVYLTDPTFGSATQGFPALSFDLAGAQGVYRLTSDGVLHLEDSTTAGPNGINFSPDEKHLYVSYTAGSSVSRFDVAEDGSLSNKQPFVSGALVADSMCVDAAGNLYVGTLSGLDVYNEAGAKLGTIAAGGVVSNCTFGGPDQTTLFITSRSARALVGAPVANDSSLYKIENMPIPGIPGRT